MITSIFLFTQIFLFIHRSHQMSSSRISLGTLKHATKQALEKLGHNKESSLIITDTLMYAELRGNNQGLIKLITGGLNFNPRSKPIEFVYQTPVSAKLNGNQQIGMIVVSKAADIAIEKAKATGISIVGCSNYASATGALGTWAKKLTDEGLIGIVMSQCNEMVAPYGSYEPIFGTNPIAIGIPTLPRAQILDMATSSMAWYGLKTAEKEGKSIPNDVAYDCNGNSTTSPTEALHGALRVFDRNYKGSHLALMVELLAGAFTGASMSDKSNANNWGTLIIAINPNVFGINNLDEFQNNAMIMCNRVKSSKKLNRKNTTITNSSDNDIMLPGERGDMAAENNIQLDSITVLDTVYEELLKIANK